MGKNTQPQKTRIGDDLKSPIKREFSSGGVVYREDKWLIRSTMPSKLYPKSYWMLPKGWIDEGEKVEEAAIREVREEGGVEARIIKKIETIKYFFKHPKDGNILKFVTFFLMEYVKDLPEGFGEETEEALWLPYDEAFAKLSFAGEKQILKKASELKDSLV